MKSIRRLGLSTARQLLRSLLAHSRGTPAELEFEIVQASDDKLRDGFRLPVSLVEFKFADELLVQGDIQVALNLLAGSQGDIQESALVLERAPAVASCPVKCG
jgi:hypothetical protein